MIDIIYNMNDKVWEYYPEGIKYSIEHHNIVGMGKCTDTDPKVCELCQRHRECDFDEDRGSCSILS